MAALCGSTTSTRARAQARAAPARRASRAARSAPRRAAARAAAEAEPRDDSQRIVITGMGVVSCFGNDVDEYYNALLEGKSGVKEISRFDASEFPTKFAAQIEDFSSAGYIDKKNDRRMDDCIRYTLVASKKAMEHAKMYTDEEQEGLDKTRVGVLVGSGMGGLQVFQDGVENLVKKGHKRITPFFIPYAITNMGSAMVAIDHGFMGPNYSISTACATANYCFTAAANHIRNGEADIIIAGGSEAPIIPVGLGGFVACRALSTAHGGEAEVTTASRPWDKNRDGFVMGEGAGVLVMESLESAKKRGANIIAEYKGGSITCDAHHMTDPRADGLGVSTCIKQALTDARMEAKDVNYINAHATSTLVGDVAEVSAIRQVFTDTKNIKMNATKSMIGHCLGAAGGMEAIACVKAIETGMLHPTLNQDDLEECVEGIDTCAGSKVEHEVTGAISNSFGFGGHNSAVIFAPYVEA